MWDTSSPSFSAFGARIPTTLPGDPRVRGHARDKMTQSAPFPSPECLRSFRPPRPVEGLTSPNCAAPRTTAFSFAMSSRVSSSAFSPLPVSHSFRLALVLSSSTPIFTLTLVIGWFLTVSLLLLSHSGASVVAVENGYPCLFFFVITQIKIPMN